MKNSKLTLLFLLILSLALFTSGCDTLMTDQTPEEGYFEFEPATGTKTGYDTEGTREVVIPSKINDVDVGVIGKEAFNLMDYFTSVEIPDSVTVIETKAFRANQLTSVDIGNSVEEIKERGFQNNSLTEVDIPDSVTLIEEEAFSGNNLTQVKIGDGVDVHSEAFDGDFKEAYEDNNKSGGVYKRDDENSDWYKK